MRRLGFSLDKKGFSFQCVSHLKATLPTRVMWCFQSFAGNVMTLLNLKSVFFVKSDLQILLTAHCYLRTLAGQLQQPENLQQDKSVFLIGKKDQTICYNWEKTPH